MMDHALRFASLQDTVDGGAASNKLLPESVANEMKNCPILRQVLYRLSNNGASGYSEGSEGSEWLPPGHGRQVPVGGYLEQIPLKDNLAQVLGLTFSVPRPTKKQRGSSNVCQPVSSTTVQVYIVKLFEVKAYNKRLEVFPGAFFGLQDGDKRSYVRVTKCFCHANKYYAQLRLYLKKDAIPKNSKVQTKIKELGLPILRPAKPAAGRITEMFAPASAFNTPLHVLHACSRESCPSGFGKGKQTGDRGFDGTNVPDHDTDGDLEQFILNTYHVTSTNF